MGVLSGEQPVGRALWGIPPVDSNVVAMVGRLPAAAGARFAGAAARLVRGGSRDAGGVAGTTP